MTFTARFLPVIASPVEGGDGITVDLVSGSYRVALRDDVLSLTGENGVTVTGTGWDYTISIPDDVVTIEGSNGITIDTTGRNHVVRLDSDAVQGTQGVAVTTDGDGFDARLSFTGLPDGGLANDHPTYLIAAQNPSTGDLYRFLIPQVPTIPPSLPAIRLSDYGTTGAAFLAAWNAIPASGGILYLPPGDVISPGGLPAKTNAWIVGAGSCLKRDDNQGFIPGTGTRIIGYFPLVDCDNFHGGGFSVDAGALVMGAAAGTDGFFFGKSNALTVGQVPVQRPRLWDISAICKGAGAGLGDHAILIQHCTQGEFQNIRGHLGQFGVVVKTTHSTFFNISGFGSSVDPVIYKSDDYAPCEYNTSYKIYAEGTSSTTISFFVYAASAPMNENKFFGVTAYGGKIGMSLFCTPRASTVAPMRGVLIDGFRLQSQVDYGFQSIGGVNMSVVTNGLIRGTASNRALFTDDETLGVDFINVTCSVPADQADNATLQGLFGFDNLKIIVNDNPAALGTLLYDPEYLSVCRIGALFAKSNYDGSASHLINGWSWFSGTGYQPRQRLENDTVALSGVLEAPASRTGSNMAAMTLLALPYENQSFSVMAYNTSTGAAFPIEAQVLTTGQLVFPLFTAAADASGVWPATARAIALGTIRYRTR